MNTKTVSLPQPKKRVFFPKEFKLSTWEMLKPYYENLLNQPINSIQDLTDWLNKRSEIDAVIGEDLRWRYIKMSCDINNESADAAYRYSVEQLIPKIAPYENQFNQKIIASPYLKELDKEKYFVYIRGIKNTLELFNEKNIPLFTQERMKAKSYGSIMADMSIVVNDQEMTLQQGRALLNEPDRALRKEAYLKGHKRRAQDSDQVNEIFSRLLNIRTEIAKNAGFSNYRDYKFKALGRFDYDIEDCSNFHEAVADEIKPIVDKLMRVRKQSLKVEKLRPWDLAVDTEARPSLNPYKNTEELINKSIKVFGYVDPFFGECLKTMSKINRLDLDSRKGKRPGGYNMTLPETNVPFIFMNSANTLQDMRTMMHEGGHAIHAFLTSDLKLTQSKSTPSEVAELAAMTMELLTMDYWGIFFENPEELKRAKIWQLERLLTLLPWVATIDKFQHWLYTNPNHSLEERKENWLIIYNQLSASKYVSWDGIEDYKDILWQRQLHLFEVPFYYIEYGMAQLGAIAIWKHYTENPQKAIQGYINALKLGYTKPIKEIYQTAGIRFDFSRKYVRELAAFVQEQLNKLLFA